MRLTKEQRIEIILMAGSGSSRMVALNFNRKHGTNITHDTVAKLISKFKKTGNVADQPRSGPRRTATDENTTVTILTALVQSPRKSTRRLSAESGVSRSSIRRILKANKWHPYKLHIHTYIRSIPSNVLMRVYQQWETRVNMCFENNGNHIEHII